MPTYEYRCRDCGHELEATQGFHDDPLTDCPACGTAGLRKRFGVPGITFKGSGFYKTDSRGSSGSSGSSSTGGSSGSGDSSSSTTTATDASSSSTSPSTSSSTSSSTTAAPASAGSAA